MLVKQGRVSVKGLTFISWMALILILSSCHSAPQVSIQRSANIRTESSNEQVYAPGSPEYKILGEVLYAQNCEACHGPIATSTKRGVVENILNQALTRPPMNSITLSSYQIGAIVFALSNRREDNQFKSDNQGLAKYELGAALYKAKCQSCHGELDVSQKRNSNLDRLNTALGNVPTMKSIPLQEIEKENIIFALNHRRSDFIGAGGTVSFRAGLASRSNLKNRDLIAAKFRYLFATDNAQNTNAEALNTISKYIENKPMEMGGLCFQGLDLACPGPSSFSSTTVRFASAKAEMEPVAGGIRSAMLLNACLELSTNPVAVNNILAKVGLTRTSNLDERNITQLKILMHPDHSLEILTRQMETASKLAAVAAGSMAKGTSRESIWIDIIAGFCQSPAMEAY